MFSRMSFSSFISVPRNTLTYCHISQNKIRVLNYSWKDGKTLYLISCVHNSEVP